MKSGEIHCHLFLEKKCSQGITGSNEDLRYLSQIDEKQQETIKHFIYLNMYILSAEVLVGAIENMYILYI